VHLDQGEDAGVLFNAVSIPYALIIIIRRRILQPVVV